MEAKNDAKIKMHEMHKNRMRIYIMCIKQPVLLCVKKGKR